MSMTYKLSEIMPPAFFELHRRIRAGEVTEALCEGGRGGAKSSFISEEIELQMMRHPDTHAVVLRRKENTLRRTVYNQYIWAAGALGVGAFVLAVPVWVTAWVVRCRDSAIKAISFTDRGARDAKVSVLS